MNRFKSENEKYIIDYLDVTEDICPELINLFYPITLIAVDYIVAFSEILTENFEEFDYQKMDIYKTIKIVKEFLSRFGKEYVDKFDKAINDGTIDVFHINNLNEENNRFFEPICFEGEEHVEVNLPLDYTAQDGAIIIHEFFHLTNSDKDMGTRDVFTELISVYMELRYFQFLNEKGYGLIPYYQELYERLNNVYKAAHNIAYSGSALDIYYNTGDINKDTIEFMNKYRKIYKVNKNNIIRFSKQDNFGQAIYDFQYDVSYLLGGVIAVNLLKEAKVNDIKIKYLNENLDKLSINDVLNIFNVDVNNFTDLTDYCAYIIKALEGVIYEDNCNSRSNRSR